jgi:hypothetical protein
MEINGFDFSDALKPKQSRGLCPDPQDESLHVSFYYKAVQNIAKSVDGVPFFEDIEYVIIESPGGKQTVNRKVKPEDKERFPNHYKAFLANRETPVTGMPIEEFPGITASEVEAFKYAKIYTVEQLASLPDGQLGVLGMDGRKKRQRAHDYIEAAKGNAPIQALRDENEKLRADLSMMKEQMARWGVSMNQPSAPSAAAPQIDIAALTAQIAASVRATIETEKPKKKKKDEE